MRIFFLPRRIPLLFVLAAFCLAAGCEERMQPGEVARINGRIIMLSQLEAMRNSAFFDGSASVVEDQNELHKQYGPALTDLLALELVKQQLEKKKMAVTDQEVLAEEALIRADYPPGAFESMLVNEGIDRENWRFLLRNTLSLRRFLSKTLRPGISVTPEETTTYYREHEAEFVRPAWAHFLLISGPNRDVVEQGKSRLAATGDPTQVQAQHASLAVRTIRMDRERLLPVFVAELDRMRPGQLSAVVMGGDEFHAMLLLETTPERRLSPTEAYPLIEETLLESKLDAAYNAWIQGRLAKSDIRVSRRLLPASALRPDTPAVKRNDTASGSVPLFAHPAKGNSSALDARSSD